MQVFILDDSEYNGERCNDLRQGVKFLGLHTKKNAQVHWMTLRVCLIFYFSMASLY